MALQHQLAWTPKSPNSCEVVFENGEHHNLAKLKIEIIPPYHYKQFSQYSQE